MTAVLDKYRGLKKKKNIEKCQMAVLQMYKYATEQTVRRLVTHK